MTGLNHAKVSMILAVMLDPSMTVRPVKLTLSLTGSHTFFSFFFIMGGMPAVCFQVTLVIGTDIVVSISIGFHFLCFFFDLLGQ